MNHIKKYCERELKEMQGVCEILTKSESETETMLSDISKIALVEINRELDERKIRKEINK